LFRASDIAQVVKSLGNEQQDVLMKYLYAGMGKPEQYNSSVLLTWHEKVTPHLKPLYEMCPEINSFRHVHS
jgi:actin related protein 2/3 complex subunit 5